MGNVTVVNGENSSARALATLCICCALSSPLSAVAQTALQCPVPDTKGFQAFLKRFEEDIKFQRSRIVLPLVVREGEYTMANVSISLWNIEKIKSMDSPLILSQSLRDKAVVSEDVLLNTKRYVELLHDGPPESDLYRMLYKFRNVSGCWFLEELHDKSE